MQESFSFPERPGLLWGPPNLLLKWYWRFFSLGVWKGMKLSLALNGALPVLTLCAFIVCTEQLSFAFFYLSLFCPEAWCCKLQVSMKYRYLSTKLLCDSSQRLVLLSRRSNFASPCNILNETILDRMARELSLIRCSSMANSTTLMFDQFCVCLSESTVLVYVNFLNLS